MPAPTSVGTADGIHKDASRCDLAAAVMALADELFDGSGPLAEAPMRALDRLRRSVWAADAALWTIDAALARRTLHQTAEAIDDAPHAQDVDTSALTLARLRTNPTIVCRVGEVSGLEELVPPTVRSYVLSASVQRGVVASILVLGWTEDAPPCDETEVSCLRLVTTLLDRAMTVSAGSSKTADESGVILGSMIDRVATLDAHGVIVTVNPAWRHARDAQRGWSAEQLDAGENYLDTCRRESQQWPAAYELVNGIEAVSRGALPRFETAFQPSGPGQRSWCRITASPLHDHPGGVVVVHSDITHQTVIELARRIGDGLFRGFTDAIPLPVWLSDRSGVVLEANRLWFEAAGEAPADAPRLWTDALHPDDRERGARAFRAALEQRASFHIELRIRAADGSFKWAACSGVPRHGTDSQVRSYVGVCWDVSAKRRAEAAVSAIAAKLVAAQEEERSRIARELHDDLGQQVALATSRMESIVSDHKHSRNKMHALMLETRGNLHDIARAIHGLSHRLHPAKLKLLGLVQTLDTLCRDVSAESGVAVRFDPGPMPPLIADDLSLCLFRVAQEATQNAIKHSRGHRIDVHISGTASELTLRVSDDGVGFDPLESHSAGIGLLTMRERVELVGGTLSVETAPNRGTSIEVVLPVQQRLATV